MPLPMIDRGGAGEEGDEISIKNKKRPFKGLFLWINIKYMSKRIILLP